MPEVNTDAMQTFLDGFSQTLPINEVAVMIIDRAGWHRAGQSHESVGDKLGEC